MPALHSSSDARSSRLAVPAQDLHAQHESIKDEIEAAVAEVFRSQQFIMGPQVAECEDAIARYCQSAHAVGVSSGTDALLLALMTEQIGPGDEVITTPYSFFATAGCVARVGARPVFVDIDRVTFNIDPNQIEAKITNKTKAIIPVHLFGHMADMDPIMEIARRRDLVVIEDAAQAIGAEHGGRRAGSIGDYGCFSFFPAKNLGCAGDGGMVVTQDASRAERMRILRVHGSRPKYYHHVIGGNFRLDTLQAAIVTVKLRHLDCWTAARQQIAARYDKLFKETALVTTGPVPGAESRAQGGGSQKAEVNNDAIYALPPPSISCSQSLTPEAPRRTPVWNQYVIRVQHRDALFAHLQSANIGCAIYYPLSLHEQTCFSYLGYQPDDFPEARRASGESLALPIYPELTDEQQDRVVSEIKEFFANSRLQ